MFRCQMSRNLLQRAAYARSHGYHPSTLRSLSTTPWRSAQKDAQDKDSLNPRSTEYSKSGSDDAAAQSDAAFDPSKTRPEEEKATASREGGTSTGGDPLEASPGNQEVSKPRRSDEGGAQGSPRTSLSGGGSAPKSGGNKSG